MRLSETLCNCFRSSFSVARSRDEKSDGAKRVSSSGSPILPLLSPIGALNRAELFIPLALHAPGSGDVRLLPQAQEVRPLQHQLDQIHDALRGCAKRQRHARAHLRQAVGEPPAEHRFNLYTRTSPFTQPPTSAPCCRSTT